MLRAILTITLVLSGWDTKWALVLARPLTPSRLLPQSAIKSEILEIFLSQIVTLSELFYSTKVFKRDLLI